MRTLTFGDRTISYDLGLDVMGNTGTPLNFQPEKFQPTERKVSLAYSDDSGAGSECSEDHEDVETERKLIKPDIMAISQLLNFDEEEEDDLTDSETDESNLEIHKSNIKCKEIMVNNLETLKTSDEVLKRRHSISTTKQFTTTKENVSSSCSSDKEILEANFVTLDESTLNLSMSEVGHIRSELAKAELEALDNTVRQSIDQGKVCYVCTTNTGFGMFRRGEKCEVCQQRVCCKCFSRVRISNNRLSILSVIFSR